MTLKYCQGPECHTYYTQDRLRGPKGNKTNQTRRRSSLLMGEFCDTRCYYAWFSKYGTRAVEYIGILRERKVMTPEHSWDKRQRYSWEMENGEQEYYYHNMCTSEQRPLTEQQFNDNNYTLNER